MILNKILQGALHLLFFKCRTQNQLSDSERDQALMKTTMFERKKGHFERHFYFNVNLIY
jgi:hypothetical protein